MSFGQEQVGALLKIGSEQVFELVRSVSQQNCLFLLDEQVVPTAATAAPITDKDNPIESKAATKISPSAASSPTPEDKTDARTRFNIDCSAVGLPICKIASIP